MKHHKKYIARFVIETQTPLGVGSGKKGLVNDRLVARDANGLPYIPATALAGIIRHELELGNLKDEVNTLFGYQENILQEDGTNKPEGQGSRIVFSSAILLASDNKTVLDGLRNIDYEEDYYASLRQLPERDHVKINDRGVAVKHGKFEEELVYKGVRFVFELELEGNDGDQSIWNKILNELCQPTFRVGGGTRKGFGQLKVVDCKCKVFNLKDQNELKSYLKKTSSLNSKLDEWKAKKDIEVKHNSVKWKKESIRLKPESFFLFGAGHGDAEVNMLPKKEAYYQWTDAGPKLSERYILIPATSVKGAISHRVAFHYNKNEKKWIEDLKNADVSAQLPFDIETGVKELEEQFDLDKLKLDNRKSIEGKIKDLSINQSFIWKNFLQRIKSRRKNSVEASKPVGENNDAVKALFGYAKNTEAGEEDNGARGKVIFSDIYLAPPSEVEEKIFNHVAIDRFTSGGRDGALFQEKAVRSGVFQLDIFIEQDVLENKKVESALEAAITDLKNGNLQLGGHTTKGHGVFLEVLENKE